MVVRPAGVEPTTLGFGRLKANGRFYSYQCLTSVRHTLKQSKTATGTASKLESGTVLTTVPTALYRKSVSTLCTRAMLLCLFKITQSGVTSL
jgi:hypothetical protein